MYKKIVIIFSSLLFQHVEQFAMFRNIATMLQRNNSLQINSIFTREFMRLSSLPQQSVSQVRLLSQVSLDKDLENTIFRLAVEEEADINILMNENVLEEEAETLQEMQQDGIEVAVLPKKYKHINWQEDFSENRRFSCFKITNNQDIPSSMIAALISYYSGQNIILLAKPRETFAIYDPSDYLDWQKRFEILFLRSKK